MPTGYFKIGFATATVTILNSIAAPLISTATFVLASRMLGARFGDEHIALALVSALLFYIMIKGALSGQSGLTMSGWTIARQVTVAWLGVMATLLLIAYATKVSAVFSRRVLFTWALLTPPMVTGFLIILRQWLRQLVLRSGNVRTAIIAGVNDMSRQLSKRISERPEYGLSLVGFFDDRGPDRLGPLDEGRLLGRLGDLPEYIRTNRIDTIFVAIPISHVQRTRELLDELRDTTASIYFVPDIFVFDLIQARTDELAGIPIVALCETPFHGWRGLTKRLTDVTLASLMLVVAAPVMLVIALAVKLTSPGAILFMQRRYGLAGEEIRVYKFRTMTTADDGAQVPQATVGDSRVTPIGRFLRRYSLDELPQLINVLQGRMSIVGPRPHAVAHNEEYRKLIKGYMIRHKVAPGITGLAQVNGCRGETSDLADMEKRVYYDLEYLRYWSLGLDFKILFRTLSLWFRDQKAY